MSFRCSICGTQYGPNAQFCKKCGARLTVPKRQNNILYEDGEVYPPMVDSEYEPSPRQSRGRNKAVPMVIGIAVLFTCIFALYSQVWQGALTVDDYTFVLPIQATVRVDGDRLSEADIENRIDTLSSRLVEYRIPLRGRQHEVNIQIPWYVEKTVSLDVRTHPDRFSTEEEKLTLRDDAKDTLKTKTQTVVQLWYQSIADEMGSAGIESLFAKEATCDINSDFEQDKNKLSSTDDFALQSISFSDFDFQIEDTG